jgi:uncharacterized protein YbjT (DUF2867 family)
MVKPEEALRARALASGHWLMGRRMILLTGGLGFISAHTDIRALASLGQPCLAATRRPVRPGPFVDLCDMVAVGHADPADPSSLLRAGDRGGVYEICAIGVPPAEDSGWVSVPPGW